MSIEVIIADDHAVVRDGIKAIIEGKGKDIKIIGEASIGREVLEIAENNPADVYVMDISMPLLNGVEAARRLTKRYPGSKVVIVSVHDEKHFVEKALKCGDCHSKKGRLDWKALGYKMGDPKKGHIIPSE